MAYLLHSLWLLRLPVTTIVASAVSLAWRHAPGSRLLLLAKRRRLHYSVETKGWGRGARRSEAE